MRNVSELGLKDMAELGAALRRAGQGARSMEEVAERVVAHLRDALGDGSGRACVLARFYKTHPYGELPTDLQEFARQSGEADLAPGVRCLTLLATVGDEPQWNDRRASRGHRTIPLASEEVVNQAPMIASLISQLGVPVSAVVQPSPDIMLDLAQRSFNVFYVAEARGSPHIPAQAEFVVPHKVKSAIGFGGMLPSGNLFAVVLFSRAPIPASALDVFRTLTLAVKVAVLPFDGGRVFREEGA